MSDFETTLFNNNYDNQVNGYQNFINVASELMPTTHTFIKIKSNGGKIKMGPFWDLLAY